MRARCALARMGGQLTEMRAEADGYKNELQSTLAQLAQARATISALQDTADKLRRLEWELKDVAAERDAARAEAEAHANALEEAKRAAKAVEGPATALMRILGALSDKIGEAAECLRHRARDLSLI